MLARGLAFVELEPKKFNYRGMFQGRGHVEILGEYKILRSCSPTLP